MKKPASRQTAKHYKDEILTVAREKTDYLERADLSSMGLLQAGVPEVKVAS